MKMRISIFGSEPHTDTLEKERLQPYRSCWLVLGASGRASQPTYIYYRVFVPYSPDCEIIRASRLPSRPVALFGWSFAGQICLDTATPQSSWHCPLCSIWNPKHRDGSDGMPKSKEPAQDRHKSTGFVSWNMASSRMLRNHTLYVLPTPFVLFPGNYTLSSMLCAYYAPRLPTTGPARRGCCAFGCNCRLARCHGLRVLFWAQLLSSTAMTMLQQRTVGGSCRILVPGTLPRLLL